MPFPVVERPLTAARLREMVAAASTEGLRDVVDLLAEALVAATDARPPLRIGEVAEFVGVSAHTLRWYESIGLVQVPRDDAGYRSYDTQAIGRIIFVTRLRLTDMPVATIREYVDLAAAGESTVPQRRRMLQDHRDALRKRIDDLAFSLAVVDYKLASYGEAPKTRKDSDDPA